MAQFMTSPIRQGSFSNVRLARDPPATYENGFEDFSMTDLAIWQQLIRTRHGQLPEIQPGTENLPLSVFSIKQLGITSGGGSLTDIPMSVTLAPHL
jgi:hypothetical protein